MLKIQLLDGKKISFVKSINGFDLTKKLASPWKISINNGSEWRTQGFEFEIKKDSKVKLS